MKNEKGFTLIETVVSIAILGIVAVGLLSGLGTASKVLIRTDERETARNLAESQMEYIMKANYATSYDTIPIPSEYAGYTISSVVTNDITSRDTDIQKIRITVKYNDRPIILSLTSNCTLENYKVNQ